MEIAIIEIRIPDRIRQDLGDLAGLKDSLKTCGQLNPITVTRELQLVAGRRRLEAARQLGWHSIEARIVEGVDALQQLQMEIQENLCRKDFTPEELLRGIKRLDRLQRPSLGRRLAAGVKRLFSRLRFKRRPPGDPNAPGARSPTVPAAHA